MPASPLHSEFREGVIHVVPEQDGIIAVCLDGEFDFANASTLSDRLARALDNGTGLIVDLGEATFIDSTVIHVLVRTAKTAAEQAKSVVLQLGTSAVVERIIQIVGIERVMPRALNRQDAVRTIQQSREAGAASSGDADKRSDDVSAAKLAAFTYVNNSIFESATRSIAQGMTWDFFCECSDPTCAERLTLTPDQYKQLRDAGRAVLAPRHQVDEQLRARALREDARALRAQAQHQLRRARTNLGRLSHDNE